MASITAMLSTLAAASVVGYSPAHRPIELVHVAAPGPRILVVGAIHGNETAGIAVVAALRRTHPHADLWLVPTFNPDGVAAGTRQNADGVDLNRNFASGWQPTGRPWSTFYSGSRPWSEPETRLARRTGRTTSRAEAPPSRSSYRRSTRPASGARSAQFWGSPSQQPSLKWHVGHCHVPCRHSMRLGQRQQRSEVSTLAIARH
jgi:hypothetical protein